MTSAAVLALLRPYAAVLSARFRVLLQYRAAALAGFATQLFWGLMRLMIFSAFFASTARPQPMGLEEVVSYIWLGQAFILLLPVNLDRDVETLIRTGNISYELTRPVDLHSFWFCRALAQRIAPALLRCAPLFILAGLWLGLQPPPAWASALAFLASLAAAVLLSAALTVFLTTMLFWTIAGDGIYRFTALAVWLMSGLVVPLPFFPEAVQFVLKVLPFSGLMDTPFRLYIGHIPPGEAWPFIARQLLWALALALLGRWTLARGLKRVVVQGG